MTNHTAQLTIRAMSGVAPVGHLDAPATALLVIDFQNEYFIGKMPIPDGMAALNNTQALIDFADETKMPVVHIQHIAPAGSAVFALNDNTVNFHPQMKPRLQDMVVQKTSVSVFASTDLHAQLQAKGIKTLIISGLMTHACVAGAARDGAALGYGIVVASDASATRAITRANGASVTADQLHASALAEIEDTFGDVMTSAQITGLALR
ncbi:isochorismatase family protein [Pseudomonas tolaasii]|uniref:cysteine hydrolase family protein n=1 Tax=Pseudomonas tolaasii TaxID=29442 RepID=UPI001C55C228|nr:isochorismatase family protein [Pseudomonas tolaasii]MBW1250799.1 isochorismatase family protein [Pseudomonas tolaasii]